MGFLSRFFGPPTPDKFASMMMARLKRAGDQRVATYDKEGFRLVFANSSDLINLGNFFAEFSQCRKADLETWWSNAIRGMLSAVEIPEEFEDVKPDLRPIVRTRSYIENVKLQTQIDGTDFPTVPQTPIGDYLAVALVYDLPTSMRYVGQDDLDTWGVTFYEAMEAARQNLEECPFAAIAFDDHLYSPSVGDSYDASRLLLKDRLEGLPLEGQPVVMAVNTNRLLITGIDDAAGLALMASLAEQFADEPRPLCSVPMRLVDGEWETWSVPAQHPLYAAFHLLEVQYLMSEYEGQRSLLNALHEKRGIDHFVAKYSAAKKDERVFSFAVWSQGVRTYLPKTDELIFFSDQSEKQLHASWEQVLDTVGHLMKRDDDYYPPRWFVEEFPTPEQFRAMGADEM